MPINKTKLTAGDKKKILASQSMTPKGRKYVAGVITAPLKAYKDSFSLVEEVLMVDKLGKGEIPQYEIEDIEHAVYALAENGQVLTWSEHQDSIIVPTAEIATRDMVKRSQLRARKYDVASRMKKKTKSEIAYTENRKMFSLLEQVAGHTIDASAGFTLETISQGISEVEENGNVLAGAILMNPANFKVIRDAMLNAKVFDTNINRELFSTGRLGTFLNAKVLVSSAFPKDNVLVVAEPEEVGLAVWTQTLEVLPVDDTNTLKIGYVAYEEVGFYVHGADNVCKIKLTK